MLMPHKIALVCTAGLCLAGCNIAYYESDPVDVETSQGVVTCQLYLLDRVVNDRAIGRPDDMDWRVADQICRDEGARIIATRG